ncbi:MAG TPA: IS256 family transposase [Vicinamibacterales bacterium]|nr:IS256 family transposase [Vicinamibacterales bacterium]
MKDTARKKDRSQGTPHIGQLALGAMFRARETLYETVVHAGMGVLAAMLEEDRTRLCGRRYEHADDRRATRGGHTDAELPFGGRRVRVRRPRVRGSDGREVALPTWQHFADADPLTSKAVEQMVLGVSTRNYDRSLEPTPAGMSSRGASKSAVSRRFVSSTEQTLTEMMGRDLSGLAICALIIDGIHVGDHLVVVALGIDEQGEKHVLGLHEGATENEATCSALIEDLVARGVRSDRSRLFVIDGSKALVAAVRKAFGRRALIQRCQVHKRRNVEDHLPESMKKQVGRTMSTAYRCGHFDRAKRMLIALVRQLDKKHPSAAASLREGLDETLTVLRFGLPSGLERTLATTNAIEFVNSRIRKKTSNVTKWNGGTMVLRWVAVALVETAKTFRKLRGHVGMPKLVAALRAHDGALSSTSVDASKEAA